MSDWTTEAYMVSYYAREGGELLLTNRVRHRREDDDTLGELLSRLASNACGWTGALTVDAVRVKGDSTMKASSVLPIAHIGDAKFRSDHPCSIGFDILDPVGSRNIESVMTFDSHEDAEAFISHQRMSPFISRLSLYWTDDNGSVAYVDDNAGTYPRKVDIVFVTKRDGDSRRS